MNTKNLLIVGGIIAGGVILYKLLKPKKPRVSMSNPKIMEMAGQKWNTRAEAEANLGKPVSWVPTQQEAMLTNPKNIPSQTNPLFIYQNPYGK